LPNWRALHWHDVHIWPLGCEEQEYPSGLALSPAADDVLDTFAESSVSIHSANRRGLPEDWGLFCGIRLLKKVEDVVYSVCRRSW